jgi:hypothetical protein
MAPGMVLAGARKGTICCPVLNFSPEIDRWYMYVSASRGNLFIVVSHGPSFKVDVLVVNRGVGDLSHDIVAAQLRVP